MLLSLSLLCHRYDTTLLYSTLLSQMNDAIEEPTAFSRTYARTVAFFQFIVIGPIAIATTIVHLLTCCCCLPLWIISVPSEVPRSIKHRVVNILSNWLTCWCTVWTSFISMMAYLVFISLCILPYVIYFIIRWNHRSCFNCIYSSFSAPINRYFHFPLWLSKVSHLLTHSWCP